MPIPASHLPTPVRLPPEPGMGARWALVLVLLLGGLLTVLGAVAWSLFAPIPAANVSTSLPTFAASSSFSPPSSTLPAGPLAVVVVTETPTPELLNAPEIQGTATREAEQRDERTRVAGVLATEAARYPTCPLDLNSLPVGTVCTALPTPHPSPTPTPYPNCEAELVMAGDRCQVGGWFPPTPTPYGGSGP